MAESLLYTSTLYDKRGSGSGYTGHHYYYCFKVYLVEQSIANNKSKIRVTQEFYQSSNALMWSTENYGPKASVEISVDGGTNYTTYTGDRIKYFWKSGYMGQTSRSVGGETQYYCESVSWTTTVSHNSNGTLNLRVRSNWIQGSGTTLQYYPLSFGMDPEVVSLPTIPRASELSDISNFVITSQNGTVSMTVTAKATFYHDLYYEVNGTVATPYLMSKERILSGDPPVTKTISYSSLLDKLPNSSNGTLKVVLKTFSSSSSGTPIGTVEKNVTFSIKESSFAPKIRSINGIDVRNFVSGSTFDLDVLYTKLPGYFIADGTCKASVEVVAEKGYGVGSISINFALYAVANQNKTYNDETASSSITHVFETDPLTASTGDYNIQAMVYVVDSRGFSSQKYYSNYNQVLGYTKPFITVAKIYRTETNSSDIEDSAGTYGYVLFNSGIGSLSSQGNSIQNESYTYQIESSGGSGTLTKNVGNHFSLSQDLSADITLSISDKIATVTVPLNINKAYVPFEIIDPRDQTGAIGTHSGFAFKSIAEPDKGKFGVPIYSSSFNSSDYYDASGGNTATFHGTADSATSATDATNAVTATNSNKQAVTESDPSGSTTYFPSFYSARTGNLPARANDGLSYYTRQGTASALGFSGIKLGNDVDQGTAGNKWGFLDIYPQVGAYYCRIRPVATLTANRTINFPNASGTAMLVPTVLWEPDDPTTVGQGGKSISVNCSGYSYIRVWAHCYDVCFSFNVDLRRIPAYTIAGATGNNVYRGSGSAPLYTTGASSARIENYYCMVQVNSAKTSVSVVQIGYIRGSSAREDRNENAAYYVYRIEGFL